MLRDMNRRRSAAEQFFSPRNKGLNFFLIVAALLSAIYQSGCSGTTTAAANANSVTDPTFGANASSINFGNVALGDSKTISLSFTNSTSSAVTILTITVSGPGFNATGIPTGTILNSGQTANLSVSFTPAGTGNESGSITLTSNAQNSSIIVSLQGTGVPSGDHLATLSWVASQSQVTGYNIYRGTISGGPYTRLNATEDTSLSYTDSSVSAGQTYYYVVTAVNSSGESSYSNQAVAMIPTP